MEQLTGQPSIAASHGGYLTGGPQTKESSFGVSAGGNQKGASRGTFRAALGASALDGLKSILDNTQQRGPLPGEGDCLNFART